MSIQSTQLNPAFLGKPYRPDDQTLTGQIPNSSAYQNEWTARGLVGNKGFNSVESLASLSGAARGTMIASSRGGDNPAKPSTVIKDAQVAADLYQPRKPNEIITTQNGHKLRVATEQDLQRYNLTFKDVPVNGKDFRARAYIDTETGHLVIGFRGTELKAGWSNIPADVN